MNYLRNFILLAAAIVLAVIAYDVNAQPFKCLPATGLSPLATGTAPAPVARPSGEGWGWVCPDGTPQSFAVLAKYKVHPDPLAALTRVWSTPTLDSINAELRAASILPAQGTIDRFEFDSLHFAACTAVAPGACGTAPVSPGVTAAVWRTPLAGTFTLYTTTAAGALGATVPLRKATANALCNCSTNKVVRPTTTYCALDVGAAAEVTLCREVK